MAALSRLRPSAVDPYRWQMLVQNEAGGARRLIDTMRKGHSSFSDSSKNWEFLGYATPDGASRLKTDHSRMSVGLPFVPADTEGPLIFHHSHPRTGYAPALLSVPDISATFMAAGGRDPRGISAVDRYGGYNALLRHKEMRGANLPKSLVFDVMRAARAMTDGVPPVYDGEYTFRAGDFIMSMAIQDALERAGAARAVRAFDVDPSAQFAAPLADLEPIADDGVHRWLRDLGVSPQALKVWSAPAVAGGGALSALSREERQPSRSRS